MLNGTDRADGHGGRADGLRVLIAGLPKSGTTILTYRITGALDDVHLDFEPREGTAPPRDHGRRNVVTKKLIGTQTDGFADYADYDRRVWICRDPRDFLVSQALYRWHRDTVPTAADRAAFDRTLALLEAKEADPATVDFVELAPADYSATFDAAVDLHQRVAGDGWFLYPYEDMVAGRYRSLNEHLGFAVDQAATVGDGFGRVARSMQSGDWRHWFTERDVDHYRSGSIERYMAAFGYPVDDWRLDPAPRIEPIHGSRYVEQLFNDYRPERVGREPSVSSVPRRRRPWSRRPRRTATPPGTDHRIR